MAGPIYPVTTETELLSQAPRQRPTTNAALWYLIYNSLLIALSILAIAFWGFSAHTPLLYTLDFGQWLVANPKKSTIIWTACGTIVAAILLFLLNSVLFLMVRQKARVGSTLSTIEGWNKCANQKPLLDIKRPWLSGFTTVNWVIALLLTTAFTTLLTPTRVLVSDPLLGDELDFTAPEFWKWYNTFDSKGTPKRKVYGCTRYTYNSSTGSIRFPTCPIADDPIAVISAGVSAAQESFGVHNASVRVVESLFKGSTGGVLPLGFEGISAFSNVKFESWDPIMAYRYPQFNYSLIQQGLSADVTCQETLSTPIQTQLLRSMEVTNSNAGGTMELRRFIVNQGNCGSNHTFVVPGIGVVAPGFCQPDATVKKYVLYLTPMGRYSRAPLSLPNMTCTFEPMITKNIVSYSTDTGLFTSSVIERMGGSGIPNETADAINSLFMISTTSWGSGLIDSMLSLNTSGDGSGNFSYAGAVEAAMRGIIEYEGTNLRIYYAANEADGRSTVNGTYDVFRMGYHQTTPTALLIVLPLIVYILVVAWWYTWTGLRTGSSIDDEFNPTNSTALVTAAAAGATSGKLGLDGRGGLNDQLVQGVRIRYVGKTGLVTMDQLETDNSLGLRLLGTETSYRNEPFP